MATPTDTDLSHAFAAECDEARMTLRSHMLQRGLHLEEGWRIHEQVRQRDGRMMIVMTPIHTRLPSPDGLECNCAIHEPSREVSSDCEAGK